MSAQNQRDDLARPPTSRRMLRSSPGVGGRRRRSTSRDAAEAAARAVAAAEAAAAEDGSGAAASASGRREVTNATTSAGLASRPPRSVRRGSGSGSSSQKTQDVVAGGTSSARRRRSSKTDGATAAAAAAAAAAVAASTEDDGEEAAPSSDSACTNLDDGNITSHATTHGGDDVHDIGAAPRRDDLARPPQRMFRGSRGVGGGRARRRSSGAERVAAAAAAAAAAEAEAAAASGAGAEEQEGGAVEVNSAGPKTHMMQSPKPSDPSSPPAPPASSTRAESDLVADSSERITQRRRDDLARPPQRMFRGKRGVGGRRTSDAAAAAAAAARLSDDSSVDPNDDDDSISPDGGAASGCAVPRAVTDDDSNSINSDDVLAAATEAVRAAALDAAEAAEAGGVGGVPSKSAESALSALEALEDLHVSVASMGSSGGGGSGDGPNDVNNGGNASASSPSAQQSLSGVLSDDLQELHASLTDISAQGGRRLSQGTVGRRSSQGSQLSMVSKRSSVSFCLEQDADGTSPDAAAEGGGAPSQRQPPPSRGSFGAVALGQLVNAFNASRSVFDENENDTDEHSSAGSIDSAHLTDDDDDDQDHSHPHHDVERVPAPVPMEDDGDKAGGVTAATAAAGASLASRMMLGGADGKPIFLAGASVRGVSRGSVGAYGVGAAEAAASASRAALELEMEMSGSGGMVLEGLIEGSGDDRGNGDKDSEHVGDRCKNGAEEVRGRAAAASGMEVDFPSRRRKSYGDIAGGTREGVARQFRRRGSLDSTQSSVASSGRDMSPTDFGAPRANGILPAIKSFNDLTRTAAIGGDENVRYSDENERGGNPDGEGDDKSMSDSSSSHSSLSVMTDYDDEDGAMAPLESEGYVPCSFITKSGASFYEKNSSTSALDYDSDKADTIQSSPGRQSVVPKYFDHALYVKGEVPPAVAAKFALEHKIFLRAVLQLLAERDRVGVEANLDDPHTIKTGPLKKSSVTPGVWKVKFVEIRRGIFSYYEDTTSSSFFGVGSGGVLPKKSKGVLLRKNIPLRSSLCTCRAVNLRSKNLAKDVGGGRGPLFGGGGFAFELTVDGGRRRLWMANSKEERQAWIRAIHEAMLGAGQNHRGSESRMRGGFLPWMFPQKDEVDQYLHIQARIKAAQTKGMYCAALSGVWGTSLRVPVQRVKEQAEGFASFDSPGSTNDVHSRLDKFWKDMARYSVSINGFVLRGDASHGSERILGALSRCILEFDRTAESSDRRSSGYRPDGDDDADRMSEVQAIAYARDILLACNRSSSNDDSYYSVDTLVAHPNLVVLCPNSSQTEPIQVEVSCAMVGPSSGPDGDGIQRSSAMGNESERTGWVVTRSKAKRKWIKRFCVLSEGVLSYYENEFPRPHGLKDQLVLVGASLSRSEAGDGVSADGDDSAKRRNSIDGGQGRWYSLTISTREKAKEHQLCFDNHAEFIDWADSLRWAIDLCSPAGPTPAAGVPAVSSEDVENSENEATAAMGIDMDGASQKGIQKGGASDGGVKLIQATKENIIRVLGPLAGSAGQDTGDSVTQPESKDFGKFFGQRRKNMKSSDKEGVCTSVNTSTDTAAEADSAKSNSRHGKSLSGSAIRFGMLNFDKRRRGGEATGETDKYPDATVQIVIQASTLYRLCAADPTGDDGGDTWGMVRTKLFRTYLLAGGPNGRMVRGDDVIEMEFLKGLVREETFQLIFAKKDRNARPSQLVAELK